MTDYSITELDISNKGLTKLPNDIHKYTNLQILYYSSNKLTSLDNLPPNLQELYCSSNPLQYDFKPSLENIRKYNASRNIKQ